MSNYAKSSDAELEKAAHKLMAERAKAEEGFKSELQAIRAERDKREQSKRVQELASGLTKEQRVELAEALRVGK